VGGLLDGHLDPFTSHQVRVAAQRVQRAHCVTLELRVALVQLRFGRLQELFGQWFHRCDADRLLVQFGSTLV